MERKYLKSFGSRIRTKLNSIKRPPDIAAKELGLDEETLLKCLNGELDKNKVLKIVFKINQIYPIKLSEIYLEEDTSFDGVVYCSNEETNNTISPIDIPAITIDFEVIADSMKSRNKKEVLIIINY